METASQYHEAHDGVLPLQADNTLYLAVNMSVVCDDGAVVYVNGVEVNRLNMPAGNITDATSALVAKNAPEESQAKLFALAAAPCGSW
jgi:hypothetical protein